MKDILSTMRFAGSAVLMLLIGCSSALANPTNLAPDNPLAAHGTIPGSVELVDSIYKLHAQQEKALIDIDARKNDSSRLPYKQLSSACGQLWKARQDAKHLMLKGEPAGRDTFVKIAMVHDKMARLALGYGSSQVGSRYRAKIIDKLKRETPKREKFLAEQAQLIANGQLEQASTQLENFGVELEEQVVFLSPVVRKPFKEKFDQLLGSLTSKLTPARQAAYQQQARQAMNANTAKIRAFVAEAKRVGDEIAATGKFKLTVGEEAQERGPGDAVTYLGKQWGAASAALIRNVAIQWAFTSGEVSKVNSAAMPQAKQIEATAKAAIIDVINATAVSTPPEDIPKVYADILKHLSFVDRRTFGSGIAEECEGALQKLAAKKPDFAKQIAAYERGTSDALRLRKRFAIQRADMLHRGYLPGASMMNQEAVITKSNKPPIFGSTSTRKQAVARKTFGGMPASWMVFEAKDFFIGNRVREDKMFRISETSLTAIVPHQGRHYSNVAVGMPIEKELDDLRTCLVIDDQHPPLTLVAADAISSAELQDFEEVGGSVNRIHLEGAVTRFITLPDVAYMLSSLGSLPGLDEQAAPVDQTCWRLDVEPHWVRHSYFTVAIPSKLPPKKQ